MSDDQQESSDQKPRARRVARSAATAERPGFEPVATPPAEGAEGAAKPEGAPAGRKWDVRGPRGPGAPPPSGRPRFADRGPRGRADGPRPPRPPRDRAAGPPGTPVEGAAAEGAAPSGDSRPRGELRDRRGPRPPHAGADERRGFRPGASGGRASPAFSERGPFDRSSPDFVDKWLSTPPRKPEDRPFNKDGPGPKSGRDRRDGPRSEQPNGDRPRTAEARGVKKAGADAMRETPPPPPPAKKLPTLHETILVGLPKVAVEAQRDKSANKPKTAKEALVAKTSQQAQKVKETASEREGEVVVDPAWVNATADNAVEVLQGAGLAAEALVDAWIHARNVDAIGEAGRSELISGAARKAARRAITILKSRGINVPERAAAAPPVRAAEEEVIEATFNPPDGRGTSSITIAKRRGGERAHIAEVILREGVGVVNAVQGWMSRSQIKEAHQRIADSSGIAPASVPVEWVRWRIQQALQLNSKSGQLVPLGLERCKDLLEPAVGEEPKHPTSDLEEKLGDTAATDAQGLHNEPEFRSWIPDTRAIEDVLGRVGAKLGADDVKNQQKVDEVLKEEMKLATDRYFTPEQRTQLARWMRDAAVTIRQRAGEERAAEVLRTARAIEQAGLITSPPSEIEFLRVYFQKGIAVMAQRTGGQLRVPVSAGAPSP